MIAYMPDIYPDELIYSWLSRWVGHCRYCVIPLYRTVSSEFAVKFKDDIKSALHSQYGDLDTFLWQHTMLPYYVLFRDEQTRHTALNWLKRRGKVDIANFMLFSQASIRCLRYCPMCAAEDRLKYGESYYHRRHQLWDVSVCIEHGCELLSTCINLGNTILIPPDSIIPNEFSTGAPCSKRQVDYSKFVVTAFDATNIDVYFDYFNHRQRLSAKYALWHSSLVDYERIVQDLHTFYAKCGICIPEAQFVQKVVDAYRVDSRIILLLLYMMDKYR